MPSKALRMFESVTGGKKHLFKISKMFSHRANGDADAVNVLHVICFVEMSYETCASRQPPKKEATREKLGICKWIQKLIVTVSVGMFLYTAHIHTHTHAQIKFSI